MPKALLKQGHRDMLRISDARMSGTSYGACILHVAPEAFIGGPLALLKTGDIVRMDLEARMLDMLVAEEEIAARRAAWSRPRPAMNAAGAICSSATSGKPIRAVTSTI